MASQTEVPWPPDWDTFHPCESEDEDFFSDEGEEELPPAEIPTIDGLPALVDYSIRGPGDWVVSGPVVGGHGRGRVFDTELEAYRWAVIKFGRSRVSRIESGEGRWGFLIKAVA